MSDTKLKSLNEIFNQKFFKIPDFQRGYSWKEDQLSDFWEDLSNLNSDRTHYTGLLTIERINKKDVERVERWKDDLWLFDKGYTAYYVVDGQQRLTTSIILINELLNMFDDDDGINYAKKSEWVSKFLYNSYNSTYKSYMFGYERDDPSDEYFKTKILRQHSSYSDKVPESTLYTSNLSFAQDFFKNKIKNLDKNNLEEILQKVVNNLKFNIYEIDDDLDIYVTFETMNNRGKSLSNLELLKNRLIYLSTLMDSEDSLKERLRKDINEVWKTIYEFLGKNKDNPLVDDAFLLNHWIMYFKYDRSQSEAYAQYLLNERFTAKAVLGNAIGFTDIKDYIDSLAVSVKAWFYLFNISFSGYSDELKEWVQKINRLGMSSFSPLLMAALVKEKNEDNLLELMKKAERFNFLVFKVSQRSSNTKNNHFYRLANRYYHNLDYDVDVSTGIDQIIHDIAYMTDGINDEGEYDGWFDLDKFAIHLKDLFVRNEGFYSWKGLRYFLYEYEIYLRDKAKGNTKITWEDFNKRKKEDTIEHIYPQTATDQSWKSAFKSCKKKEKEVLLHSLGNLLLLNNSKNSELQNYNFEFKKKHKNKSNDDVGFFNGSYSEIEVSSYTSWGPAEIRNRGIKMIEFLENRWNVNFEDWYLDKSSVLLNSYKNN